MHAARTATNSEGIITELTRFRLQDNPNPRNTSSGLASLSHLILVCYVHAKTYIYARIVSVKEDNQGDTWSTKYSKESQ
jgi:hypothetical protein